MRTLLICAAVLLLGCAYGAGHEQGGGGNKGKGDQGKGGDADNGRDMKQGLVAHYFKDPFEWDGNWKEGAKPKVQAKEFTFRSYQYTRDEPLINHVFVKRGWFSIRWVGYIKVPPGNSSKKGGDETLEVTFDAWMDDGARLFIDGQQYIDDWRPCAENEPGAHRKSTVKLTPGFHRIAVEYFQGESLKKNDNDPAKLFWEIPAIGIKHQIIAASHFFHSDADETDVTPSQGLSPEDQQALQEGTIPHAQK